MENIQDYAFLVTDGIINVLTMQDGCESYDEAKTYLNRRLASNWSIVEDQEVIDSYIKDSLDIIDELKKYESARTKLKELQLLIKQRNAEWKGAY